MKFLFSLFSTFILLSYSLSASAQSSGNGADYESMYQNVAKLLSKMDEAQLNQKKNEDPEIFTEIDSVFEKMQNFSSNKVKTMLADKGINIDKFKPSDTDKISKEFKNFDFSSIYKSPEFMAIKQEFAEKMKQATKMGLQYKPKMFRNPMAMSQMLINNDPNAINGIAKYLQKNKDMIINALKANAEANKARRKSNKPQVGIK